MRKPTKEETIKKSGLILGIALLISCVIKVIELTISIF